MSFEAAYWASSIPASDSAGNAALRTLTVLGLHADEDGHAWPKVKLIAAERSSSPSTVKRHLHDLEAADLIKRVDDSPLVAHIPANHRPIVWHLALDFFGGSQVATPSDLEGSQGGPLEGSQVEHLEGSHVPKSSKEVKTGESQEKGARAMNSAAWDELGGKITALEMRRYPKQCIRHQDVYNTERCGGCASTKEELSRLHADRERMKRQREIDDRKHAYAEAIAGAKDCDRCNDEAKLPNGTTCWHDVSIGFDEAVLALRQTVAS